MGIEGFVLERKRFQSLTPAEIKAAYNLAKVLIYGSLLVAAQAKEWKFSGSSSNDSYTSRTSFSPLLLNNGTATSVGEQYLESTVVPLSTPTEYPIISKLPIISEISVRKNEKKQVEKPLVLKKTKSQEKMDSYLKIIKEVLEEGKLSKKKRALASSLGIELSYANYGEIINFYRTREQLIKLKELPYLSIYNFYDTALIFLAVSPDFNNKAFLNKLIDLRIQIGKPDEEEINHQNIFSSLMIASCNFLQQNQMVIEALKKAGGSFDYPIIYVDVEHLNLGPITHLMHAVLINNFAEIQRSIKFGANEFITDNLGNTPLHYAMGRGDLAVITSLQPHNLANKDNRTPFDVAISSKSMSLVKLLFYRFFQENESTANKQVVPLDGPRFSRLFKFAADHEDGKFIEQLITKGYVDTFAPFALNGIREMTKHKNVGFSYRTVDFMLRRIHGLNLNTRNEKGESLLHYAARGRNHKLYELFLSYGVDANFENSAGEKAHSILYPKPIEEPEDSSLLWAGLTGLSTTLAGFATYFYYKRRRQLETKPEISEIVSPKKSKRAPLREYYDKERKNGFEVAEIKPPELKPLTSTVIQYSREKLEKWQKNLEGMIILYQFIQKIPEKKLEGKAREKPYLIRCYINFLNNFPEKTRLELQTFQNRIDIYLKTCLNKFYLDDDFIPKSYLIAKKYYKIALDAQFHEKNKTVFDALCEEMELHEKNKKVSDSHCSEIEPSNTSTSAKKIVEPLNIEQPPKIENEKIPVEKQSKTKQLSISISPVEKEETKTIKKCNVTLTRNELHFFKGKPIIQKSRPSTLPSTSFPLYLNKVLETLPGLTGLRGPASYTEITLFWLIRLLVAGNVGSSKGDKTMRHFSCHPLLRKEFNENCVLNDNLLRRVVLELHQIKHIRFEGAENSLLQKEIINELERVYAEFFREDIESLPEMSSNYLVASRHCIEKLLKFNLRSLSIDIKKYGETKIFTDNLIHFMFNLLKLGEYLSAFQHINDIQFPAFEGLVVYRNQLCHKSNRGTEYFALSKIFGFDPSYNSEDIKSTLNLVLRRLAYTLKDYQTKYLTDERDPSFISAGIKS